MTDLIKTRINFACVLDHDTVAATRLYEQVCENVTTPFDFYTYCGAHDEVDANKLPSEIKVQRLQYDRIIPGSWDPLKLFSNDIGIHIGQPVVYLGHNLTIIDNIDEIVNAPCAPTEMLYFTSYEKPTIPLMKWNHGYQTYRYLNFKFNVLQMRQKYQTNVNAYMLHESTSPLTDWYSFVPGEQIKSANDIIQMQELRIVLDADPKHVHKLTKEIIRANTKTTIEK